MEFLRGSSLQARIASPGAAPLDEKLNVIIPVVRRAALRARTGRGASRHQAGEHLPAARREREAARLRQSAKLATSTLTRQGDVLGSAMYMSPEQVSGSGDVDGRSDIFSTGGVLYEMLANRKPFMADTLTATVRQAAARGPAVARRSRAGLPAQLVGAVKKALSKEPAAVTPPPATWRKSSSGFARRCRRPAWASARSTRRALRAPTQLFELNKTLEKDRLQAHRRRRRRRQRRLSNGSGCCRRRSWAVRSRSSCSHSP
jgi:serine/threonine protein kinase